MRRNPAIRAAALFISVLSACLLSAPALAGGTPHVVLVRHLAFTPSQISVRRGESVTWRFLDAALLSHHNVTSTGGARFRSSRTMTTGSYTVRFDRPGTYRYMCTVHFFMTGSVVVRR